MTSVVPAHHAEPVASRRTPSRKVPSPYQSVKNRAPKTAGNFSRNNTFIATSGHAERNGREEFGHDENGEQRFPPGKAKSSSAGAVEGLLREPCSSEINLVDIFKGDGINLSEASEEDQQRLPGEDTPVLEGPPTAVKKITKKSSAIPVKTSSYVGRPLRSQRSVINGSDSKTIRFLLKLTTKSYFETLKYEIDRIKENDRKLQDQTSSHGHSITALISKGAECDRIMEDLIEQNARLLLETREKDKVQQDTVNAITSELNELKSVCNLLLKNIEKDHELDILARKLRKSKKFDSNTYNMLKTQLRKPIHVKNPDKPKSPPKLKHKATVTSIPSKVKSDAVLLSKRKGSKSSITRQKSDWSSLSSMSSVSTRTDMLSDIEITSDRKSCPSEVSLQSLNQSNEAKQVKTKSQEGRKSSIMTIFCCGKRSKVSKSEKTN